MKRWVAWGMLLLLLGSMSGCKRTKAFSLTAMTQNLRVDVNDGAENDVLYRSERFVKLVEQYQPDVVGMQEYTSGWDFMLSDFLESGKYKIVFQYRSETDQEATPVLYNAEKLELVDTQFFWLSDTPDTESPSWDDNNGKRCRIATQCTFRDRKTGIEFVHINTHLGLTALSQSNSGTLLNQRVRDTLAGKAVFVTGDFNCSEGSEGYNNTVADGVLNDSFYHADSFGNTGGTMNGYHDGATATIDYIFVTPKVSPTYYSVLTDKPDGGFISDHYAVLTQNTVSR